jgi:hypothetical protein
MKKSVLMLALLLMVSIGGCITHNTDITDTVTSGTWRVGYFIAAGDEHTALFNGYVFTFLTNGTVTVARPDLPPAQGTWNESDSNTRFKLAFGAAGLLERLNENWVVDDVQDNEILMHELGAPLNQFELQKR